LSTDTLRDAGLVVAAAPEPVEVCLLDDLLSALVWVPLVAVLRVELEAELAPLPPPPELSTIATITITATTMPPTISVVVRAGERRSAR
jgi:hypothetical protein